MTADEADLRSAIDELIAALRRLTADQWRRVIAATRDADGALEDACDTACEAARLAGRDATRRSACGAACDVAAQAIEDADGEDDDFEDAECAAAWAATAVVARDLVELEVLRLLTTPLRAASDT